MRVRRRWLGVVLLLSVLRGLMGAGAAPASAHEVSGTGIPRASLFRAEVALFAEDHDISFQVAAQQLEWQRLAPDLQDRARQRLGSNFGGVWIDNADAGRVKLGIVAGNAANLSLARKIVAESGLIEAVDIVLVPHSEVQLNRIVEQLSGQLMVANSGSAAPIALGVAPDESSVRISLPRKEPLTFGQEQFVINASEEYGSAVGTDFYDASLRFTSCGYPYCNPPLRAGIRVGPTATFNPPEPGGVCTGAFLARGKAPDTTLYQLTAGHCAFKSTWGTQLSPTGPVEAIGSWQKEKFGEAGDVGMYKVNEDSFWHARPWVYWAGYSESYPIFSDAMPVKGQAICASGSGSGESKCGKVTQLNLTVTVEGVTLKGMIRANFCASPGDSGAPVHYFGVAYGLLSGGSEVECDTFSTPVTTAEELMSVNVRHESECDPLFESPVKIGDMTGDLKADVFQLPGEGNGWAWESKGTSYSALGKIGSGFGSAYQDRVGDMDGDGDEDLFQMTDNGDLYGWESKGTSYSALGKIGSGFGSACDTRLGDINGDSRDDIFRFTNDGYAYGWLDKAGGGYESLGQIGTGFGSTYQDRSGDMDGDGDDDLFQITDEGNAYAWLSNGSSYVSKGLVATGVGKANEVRIEDRDGDGDDDLFQFTAGGDGYAWRSNGTSYTSLGKIGTGFGLTRQVRVADIDGDLDADILKFADDGNGYAWTFNGSTYTSIGKVGSGFGAP